MNFTSRTITGGIMILIGFVLVILGFFTMFITWFYGIPVLVIGVFILFNKNEDEIEERKDINKAKRRVK